MPEYQPKTGERCACRRGIERDNCPSCEGTGWRIDFRAIREKPLQDPPDTFGDVFCGGCHEN